MLFRSVTGRAVIERIAVAALADGTDEPAGGGLGGGGAIGGYGGGLAGMVVEESCRADHGFLLLFFCRDRRSPERLFLLFLLPRQSGDWRSQGAGAGVLQALRAQDGFVERFDLAAVGADEDVFIRAAVLGREVPDAGDAAFQIAGVGQAAPLGRVSAPAATDRCESVWSGRAHGDHAFPRGFSSEGAQTSGFEIPGLKSQISNLKSQISDLRSQISNLKSQISNARDSWGAPVSLRSIRLRFPASLDPASLSCFAKASQDSSEQASTASHPPASFIFRSIVPWSW